MHELRRNAMAETKSDVKKKLGTLLTAFRFDGNMFGT